ncbi:MAG TPA: flagellar biosynthesis protein FlhF [Xanthomonadaceae bacterium]|nr:flagellar biosynthesis protein FlhF [Xanthomonadaceae bacterium]
MKIKRFVAPDMRTALRLVREEQGPDAVILSNRPTEGGIEVVAATDYDEALVQQALRAATPAAEPAPVVPIRQARAPAPRTALDEVADAAPASRADAMIAALAGGTRTAQPARDVRANAPQPPRTQATEAAPARAAVPAAHSGDEFRALLARLVEAEGREGIVLPAAALPVTEPEPASAPEPAPAPQPAPVDPPVAQAATPEPAARLADVLRLDRDAADAVEAPAAARASEAPAQPKSIEARPESVPVAPVQVAAVAAANETDIADANAAPVLRAVPAEDPALLAMRAELAAMRALIEKQMGELAIERLRGSPARAAVFDALLGYGCDDAFAETIASRIDARMDPAQARTAMLDEFARMIAVQRAEPIDDGGVIALVGPTGAGKTTTAAKLAARFAERHRARDVALVTTDTERPGAREQLHSLGRKLGITVCEAEGPEGINAALAQLVDYPLVLVDTAGYAMRDRALLGQILWLRTARRVRSLLVLPANAHPQDLAEVARRYRPASPEGVVLTKTDETGRLGAALSLLAKQNLSLAYTTCGQQVPGDLDAADPARLVQALEKLRRAADNPLATEDRHAVA